MATTRFAYAGAPLKTTISAGINTVDTAITIASATGWPTGAPFPMVIDPGQAGEEKILGTRSGSSITATTRGYDGTTAALHSSGAVIYPCATATEVDTFNRLAATPTTKGDLIGADASGNPVRLAVGTDHRAVIADSSQASGLAYANAAKGQVAFASTTTAQAAIGTSATDLTSLTVTWTAIASRAYRTTLVVRLQQLTAAATSFCVLTDGSGAEVQGDGFNYKAANDQHGFVLVLRETGLSGSITRKGRAAAGANTLQTLTTATSPAFILVEDIGPA